MPEAPFRAWVEVRGGTLYVLARTTATSQTASARQRVEYWLLATFVAGMRMLPRSTARNVGAVIGGLVGRVAGRLSAVGKRNLSMAFPALHAHERAALLHKTYRNLGLQLAEFCQMSKYTPTSAQHEIMRYEGLERLLAAEQRGKGVLILTGHLGAWELSSFVHSLLGHPMGLVIRRLDNPLVDRMVNAIRCQHGNRVLHKDDFARGLLHAMAKGETVGILMDTNMTPPQGVFVPFFGMEACTASGLARVARKTGAAVLPGFLLWEETEQRYVLRFGEELQLQQTEHAEADAVTNTALMVQVTEEYIRRYPDQWLWLHRRWKTRPAGEEPLYGTAKVPAPPPSQAGKCAASRLNGDAVGDRA